MKEEQEATTEKKGKSESKSEKKDEPEENECPICFTELNRDVYIFNSSYFEEVINDFNNPDIVVKLPCQHQFHLKCFVAQCMHGSTSCPYCRTSPVNLYLFNLYQTAYVFLSKCRLAADNDVRTYFIQRREIQNELSGAEDSIQTLIAEVVENLFQGIDMNTRTADFQVLSDQCHTHRHKLVLFQLHMRWFYKVMSWLDKALIFLELQVRIYPDATEAAYQSQLLLGETIRFPVPLFAFRAKFTKDSTPSMQRLELDIDSRRPGQNSNGFQHLNSLLSRYI
jgi:hypothetical protein